MPKRIALSWSTGKDSAWMLHLLRRDPEIEISALITTINESADRVAMHAVRRELLDQQAAAAALPLWPVALPWPCSNDQYECIMREVCARAVAEHLDGIAFGDLYLADIRAYRERQLQDTGLEPIFPLWQIPTDQLAAEMIASGLRAKVTCIDPRALPREFVARDFDTKFLNDLPAAVDPCGENGEFHTFAYSGPMFSKPISVVSGEIVERDGFVFADLHSGMGLP
jgi:uncharacterized protein (TIGR00290 family)